MREETIYSEDQLLDGCKKGDRRFQRLLYERYSKKMYVVCMRYSKTTLEADDILQDAFLRVFQYIHDFKKECPFEYWVKRIVINTALKYNRRMMDKAKTEEVSDLNYKNEEDLILSEYNFMDLIGFIRKLAPRYQMIFNLYAIEGYKHKEIADMLEITEGTSKSQFARAKSLIQEMIAKDEKHEQIKEQL